MAQFGYIGLFGIIFLEQLGLPLPSFPFLLAVGVSIGAGKTGFVASVLLAMTAALLADAIWYWIGMKKGGGVLFQLCRISLKPDSCVSKTKEIFTRFGPRTLLFSKFFPGLGTIVPPLSGMTGLKFTTFLFYDAAGTLIWCLVPLGTGMVFGENLPSADSILKFFKTEWPWLCALILLAYAAWRWWDRREYYRTLEKELEAAVTPAQLKARLAETERLVVLDVRHSLELKYRPSTIPRTMHIPLHELKKRAAEIPAEYEVVAFCDCPKEQAAVAAVQLLRERGHASAVPLLGGLQSWIKYVVNE